MNLVNRIPKLEQIFPVYAVVTGMVYSWSLLRFFWKLPSWLYYSSVGEISTIFAYMVVINLFESVVVMLAPILISIVLPQKWFYDQFVAKGSTLMLLSLGYLMYFDNHLYYQKPFPLDLVYQLPLVALTILALVFLLTWIRIFNKIVIELANRLTVFLYILIPVSCISLLIVLIRNIF